MALEDIGEDGDALLCVTNLTAYTDENEPIYSIGNWFFPNGTRVSSFGNHYRDLYRDTGQMVIRLNRRRGGVNGIYRCEIPYSANVTQTIYIGVYSAKLCNGE